MGTFTIIPTSLSSGGTPFFDLFTESPGSIYGYWYYTSEFNGVKTLLELITSLVDLPFSGFSAFSEGLIVPTTFTDTIRLTNSGNCIFLDGSPVGVNINSLPTGFTPLTASIEIDPTIDIQPDIAGGGVCEYFLQKLAGNNGTANTSSFPYDFNTEAHTMLAIHNNGLGFKVHMVANLGIAQIQTIFGLRIEGTYEIQSFSFTLNPSPLPLRPGSQILVTSVGPDSGLNLSELVIDNGDGTSGINIIVGSISYNIPSSNIVEYTSTSLIFIVPSSFIPTTQDIEVTVEGNGTQFSGSMSLGILEILNEDASGIYRIVKNKTSDTFYVKSAFVSVINLLFSSSTELFVMNDDIFDIQLNPYRIIESEVLSEEDDLFLISELHTVTSDVGISNIFARTGFVGT